RSAGEIGPVRLVPGHGLCGLFGRRYVHGVVQPAMPVRWHPRRLRIVPIGHPAPLEAEPRIDLATSGAEVPVAELVIADMLAVEPSPYLRAESLAVPPSEEAQQEGFHRGSQLTGVQQWRT